MNIVAIIQARMGSSRLPGKVLQQLYGETTLLDCVITSIREARYSLEVVVVATSTSTQDDPLVEHCKRIDVPVVRGAEQNVLKRYVEVLERYPCDGLIRVCADNPLLDGNLLSDLLELAGRESPDYAGHITVDDSPAICTGSGLFVEYASASALRRLDAANPPLSVAEHVTLGIYTGTGYRCLWHVAPLWACAPWLRLTCDTERDLATLRTIYSNGPRGVPRHELVGWLSTQSDLQHEMLAGNLRDPKPSVRISRG